MEIVAKQAESGRWYGWIVERPDIICSGETKDEFTENIKEMYEAVIEYEKENPPK